MDEFPARLDNRMVWTPVLAQCCLNSIHQIPKISVELMTCLQKFWAIIMDPFKANGWKPKMEVLKMMFLFRMIPILRFLYSVLTFQIFIYSLVHWAFRKKNTREPFVNSSPNLHRWYTRIRSLSLSMSLKNEHHR